MKMNEAGIDLIRQFEGCRLTAYKDIVGVWTIGYGATGDDVCEGLEWTQAQANERLASDLTQFESGVKELVDCELNDNQFSALVCFSYNLGLGSLKSSTLLKKVNDSDFSGAADEFLRWDRAGGQVVPGLLRRRQAERALFSL